MSFPAYPEYKSSGVAWLGEVPSHWDVKRLGFFFWERREKVSDVDYAPLSVTKGLSINNLEKMLSFWYAFLQWRQAYEREIMGSDGMVPPEQSG